MAGCWPAAIWNSPPLAELRQRVASATPQLGRLTLREVVADVQKLNLDPANAGALFQVASQFNLLEMTSLCPLAKQSVTHHHLPSRGSP